MEIIGLFPARTHNVRLRSPPRRSHVFCGRHATRDASKPIFLTSKATPVLGQTLIDHLRRIMLATLRPIAWVVTSPYHPYISFSIAHTLCYPVFVRLCVQISEDSIWNVFRSLDRSSLIFILSTRSSSHRQSCCKVQIPFANLRSLQRLHSMIKLFIHFFYRLHFQVALSLDPLCLY